MTEIKASCPKCGGHIAFPPEIAGQETSCPHCNEGIVLAKKSSVTGWVLMAAAVIGLIFMGTVMVLKHPSKAGEPTKNFDAERHLSTVEFLQAKADQGDAEAMLKLGAIYASGNGVPTNTAVGEDWYRKAAALGNSHAMTALGDAFLQKYYSILQSYSGEQATTVDPATGLPVAYMNAMIDPSATTFAARYQRVIASTNALIDASTGLPVSSTNVVIDPATGLPMLSPETPNQKLFYGLAASWYRKAAELGDTNAMRKFVGFTDPSTGLPTGLQNVEEAERARWTRKLADAGDVEAMALMGLDLNLKKDYAEEAKWDAKAAEGGDESAQFRLARLYDQGLGLPSNKETAVKWYTAAAQQGNSRAQFYLGVKYDVGDGVTADKSQAFQWYLKAADGHKIGNFDLGAPEAQFNLGIMYRDGEGVTKDRQEALNWFLRAAKNSDAAAQYEAGRAYETGVGVLQDRQEAFKWYQKAAYQGEKMAERKVGRFYEEVGDSPQNRIAAHKWLSLAAAQGDETAARERDSVAVRMSAQELAEASRQAKAFTVGEPPTTNGLPTMPVARGVPASLARTPTSQSAFGEVPATVLNGIKQAAAREWPTDYEMQAYKIKNQVAAYKELQQLIPGDIPPDAFQRIKIAAVEEWPGDYEMQVHKIRNQVKAYQDLRK
jgi:uncharacterized protein